MEIWRFMERNFYGYGEMFEVTLSWLYVGLIVGRGKVCISTFKRKS